MTASSLFHALTRFCSPRTRAVREDPPPRRPRRRPVPRRPRLEVERLDDRLSPSQIVLVITDPSQLPLTLPQSFQPGQQITFEVSAASNDSTEGQPPDNEPEYLTISAHAFLPGNDLNQTVQVGQTLPFQYTFQSFPESSTQVTITASDGDEIGTISYSFVPSIYTFQPGVGGMSMSSNPEHVHEGRFFKVTVDIEAPDGPHVDQTFNGVVSLQLGNNLVGATLNGGKTGLQVRAHHGVATFGNVRINRSLFGDLSYALIASADVHGQILQVMSSVQVSR
jgi:hypothetical protein